jgi:hypothetical protein
MKMSEQPAQLELGFTDLVSSLTRVVRTLGLGASALPAPPPSVRRFYQERRLGDRRRRCAARPVEGAAELCAKTLLEARAPPAETSG